MIIGPRPSTAMELGDLLAAPVVALVDANARAALRSLSFIQSVGFGAPAPGVQTPAGATQFGGVRSIAFSVNTPAGPRTVTVPSLSLVPVPLTQVTEAEFTYTATLLEASPYPWENAIDLSRSLTPPLPEAGPPRMMVAFGPTSSPTIGAMHIVLRVRQDDLPQGVSSVLNILNNEVLTSPPRPTPDRSGPSPEVDR